MKKKQLYPHILLSVKNNNFTLSYEKPLLVIDYCVDAALNSDGDLPEEIKSVVLNLFLTLCLNDESYMLDAIRYYESLKAENIDEEE